MAHQICRTFYVWLLITTFLQIFLLMKTIIITLLLLALVACQDTKFDFEVKDGHLVGRITSDQQLVVIGFSEQENLKDFLFCSLTECACRDMVTDGRSHPLPNAKQGTKAVCPNEDTLIFDRIDNQLKPYVWDNPYTRGRRSLQGTTAFTDSDMTGSVKVDNDFTLKWKFNSDSTIEFAIIFSKKSWVGLGFGKGMKNVDMVIVNLSGTTVTLLDCFATAEAQPPVDTQNDLTLISSEVADSGVKVRFKRKLNTGDTKDTVLAKDTQYTFSYAYSNAQTMVQHTTTKEFTLKLSETLNQTTQVSNGWQLAFAFLALLVYL